MSNMKNFKEAFNSIFGTSKNNKDESVVNKDDVDLQKQDSNAGESSQIQDSNVSQQQQTMKQRKNGLQLLYNLMLAC